MGLMNVEQTESHGGIHPGLAQSPLYVSQGTAAHRPTGTVPFTQGQGYPRHRAPPLWSDLPPQIVLCYNCNSRWIHCKPLGSRSDTKEV